MSVNDETLDAAAICLALDIEAFELAEMFEANAAVRLRLLADNLEHLSSDARSHVLERVQQVLWIAETFSAEWARSHPEEEGTPGDFTGGDPMGVAPGAHTESSEPSVRQ